MLSAQITCILCEWLTCPVCVPLMFYLVLKSYVSYMKDLLVFILCTCYVLLSASSGTYFSPLNHLLCQKFNAILSLRCSYWWSELSYWRSKFSYWRSKFYFFHDPSCLRADLSCTLMRSSLSFEFCISVHLLLVYVLFVC